MAPNVKQVSALNVRVWYVRGGVHPARTPEFLSLGKFGDDPAQTIGEATRVGAPDPNNFDRDIPVGTIPGATERATFSISSRYTVDKSILMDWKNRRCRVDIFALVGKCGNPQDFSDGGEKWTYFPDGEISGHSLENFGAFDRSENNPTNDMVPMTSEEYYELLKMRQETIGASETVREIYTIDTYAGDNCDDCPDPCLRVLATMAGASATPGTQPILLYSDDGGLTWDSEIIDTMFSNEDVADAQIIGGDFVLITNTGHEFHYTNVDDLYADQNSWQQNANGFVAGKGPNALSSPDVRHVWVVGDGGYIYFTKNHKTAVEVQDAGVATAQNLNAVHALDTENVLAVGDSNAVIYTGNGGDTWEAVTGPSVGVNMGACWMWDESVWLVGEGAGGNGKLWMTQDSGHTWSEILLPNTYLRIDKIAFVSEAEGYLSARTGGQSYILRTITAGNEWTVLPQGKLGVGIDNSYLSDIAVCSKYANSVYAAGMADNGTAGIILKMSA